MCDAGSGAPGSGGAPGEYAGGYDFSTPSNVSQGIAVDEALDGPGVAAQTAANESFNNPDVGDYGAMDPQSRGMFGGLFSGGINNSYGLAPAGQITTTPGVINLGAKTMAALMGASPLGLVGLAGMAARLAGAKDGTDQDFSAMQGDISASGDRDPSGLINVGILDRPTQPTLPVGQILSRFGVPMAVGRNYRS
jgi:hypothetical protein